MANRDAEILAKARAQLRKLRIDDVSSVDRGAGRGTRVMLTKRDTPRAEEAKPVSFIQKLFEANDEQLALFVKADAIPSASCAHGLLEVLAKRRQRPDETKEQAFARTVTDGGLGSLLFHKAQEMTRGWTDGRTEAVEKLVEHPVRKLGGGTLPQPTGEAATRSTRGPVAPRGYDPDKDVRRPPDDDADIADADTIMGQLQRGEISWAHPDISRLHRAEMKRKREAGAL